MSSRWNIGCSVIAILVGIGGLLLFLSVDAIGWKSILLLLMVLCILDVISRWLSFYFFPWMPEGHRKRLVSSAAILSGSLYYILHGQSIIWTAFSWIFLLLVGGGGLLFALQGIFVEGDVIRTLKKAYKEGRSPDLSVPFIYILAEPGQAVREAHSLIGMIVNSLMRYRYFPAVSKFQELPQWNFGFINRLWKYHLRIAMTYVISDSVRRYPISFRRWLVSHAAALVVIRTPLGVHKSLERDFNDEVNNGYQTCLGPTFMIYLRSLLDNTPTPPTKADQTLEYTLMAGSVRFNSIVPPLTDRLAQTALPTQVSDSRLTEKSRSLIKEVATSAWPPIADCYLRFRLAQSGIERFLSLFDGIECLIKCSAIVLLVNRWRQTGLDLSRNPLGVRLMTLGNWIHLLQRLTEIVGPDGLDAEICDFWKGDEFQVQAVLVSEFGKTELPLPDISRISQLDWLEWFRNLRNVTRGHGVVTEEFVAPFWHLFHETFLEMIAALKSLTLSPVLAYREPDGRLSALRGWLRGGQRAGSQSCQHVHEYGTLAFLKLLSDQVFPLHPLVIIRGDRVFLWDCVRRREEAIEFLNYASGEREQLALSEFPAADPYKIWLEVQIDFSKLAFRSDSC